MFGAFYGRNILILSIEYKCARPTEIKSQHGLDKIYKKQQQPIKHTFNIAHKLVLPTQTSLP